MKMHLENVNHKPLKVGDIICATFTKLATGEQRDEWKVVSVACLMDGPTKTLQNQSSVVRRESTSNTV